MFDWNQAVRLLGVSSSNVFFVQYEEVVPYCQKWRNVMEIAGSTEIPASVDSGFWYVKRPYTELHSFYGDWLRYRVLGLEVQQCTTARNALLIGWHNEEEFAVPPSKWEKYYAIVEETCRDWKLLYKLGVPTLPFVSYYTEVVSKGSHAETFAHCIAEMKFLVSAFVIFI